MDSIQLIDTVKIIDTVLVHINDTTFVSLDVIDTIKNVIIHSKDPFWKTPLAIAIFGTFLGVIFSPLKDLFVSLIFKPGLTAAAIDIKEEFIIKEKSTDFDDYAFYCHLKIENTKKTIANHVRIMVTRFRLFQDGESEVDKSFENGYIPLRWQWEILDEKRFNKTPSIGSVKWCDLFRVSKKNNQCTDLTLQDAVDIPSVQYGLCAGKKSQALITIVALSDENESKPQTFCVTWNGELPDNFETLDDMTELNITFQCADDCLKRGTSSPHEKCRDRCLWKRSDN